MLDEYGRIHIASNNLSFVKGMMIIWHDYWMGHDTRCAAHLTPVFRAMLVTLAPVMLAAGSATAQPFPSKAVRLVVPGTAGGSNDVVARAMSSPLSKALGQSVVVENRPGASSVIGAEMVARSPPDGHTVLIGGFPFMSLAALRTKLPFDPIKDFVAVTRIGTQPSVISVHPSLPVKSIKELIALARARPGQLVYACSGYGTAQHLSGELLKVRAGIDMKLVVFQGPAQSTTAVLGGHASILITTLPPIMHHIPAGKLRPLAVTSRERSHLLKDVPTMMEAGVPEFDISGGMGVFAPAATPKAAIERLNSEITRVVQLPEVKDGMLRDGFVVAPMGPAEYEAFMHDKIQQIRSIAKAANIKFD
jgi:tripartite-type tricarboxylate transporter receptor subunit TctC